MSYVKQSITLNGPLSQTSFFVDSNVHIIMKDKTVDGYITEITDKYINVYVKSTNEDHITTFGIDDTLTIYFQDILEIY